ncbi:MAG: patatin-like phospholipase family protein [Phaeodactylibacter sp.]|nr:patatin-like phospholipase family protein [Phaeodactylibacter sp.]MCB9049266.1 patatin-like phospholipase family protein [Lewinellaceae bacterium]
MSLFSYSVLSIDGGGIRGIIPCTVLAEIEKRTGKPVAELFDLIAGTSTGGILAGGLAMADENGKPRKSAEGLLGLYLGKNGKKIFRKTFPGLLNYLRLPFTSLFPAGGMEQLLKQEFGDARLKDSLTNLLITSYNTQEKLPFYFRSSLARKHPEEDFEMREIVRATSAAPTYFPPKQLKYTGKLRGQRMKDLALIDGGVFANNPSVLAYVEAMQMWKESPEYKNQFKAKVEELAADRDMAANPNPDNFAPPILLVSIGTGQTRKTYAYSRIRRWGLRWLMPLIDIFMQGVSESVHYQMKYLLPDYIDSKGNPHPRYYRLNIEIDADYSDMSDASEKNTKQLEQYGKDIIAKYDKEIDNICRLLGFIVMEREERMAEG